MIPWKLKIHQNFASQIPHIVIPPWGDSRWRIDVNFGEVTYDFEALLLQLSAVLLVVACTEF